MSLADVQERVKKHTQRAMWLQLESKNRTIQALQGQISDLEKWKVQHSHGLASVKFQWATLAQELQNLYEKSVGQNSSEADNTMTIADGGNGAKTQSSQCNREKLDAKLLQYIPSFQAWLQREWKLAGLKWQLPNGVYQTEEGDSEEDEDSDDDLDEDDKSMTSAEDANNTMLKVYKSDEKQIRKFHRDLDKRLGSERAAMLTALRQILDVFVSNVNSGAPSLTVDVQKQLSELALFNEQIKRELQEYKELLVLARRKTAEAIEQLELSKSELANFKRAADRKRYDSQFQDASASASAMTEAASGSSLNNPQESEAVSQQTTKALEESKMAIAAAQAERDAAIRAQKDSIVEKTAVQTELELYKSRISDLEAEMARSKEALAIALTTSNTSLSPTEHSEPHTRAQKDTVASVLAVNVALQQEISALTSKRSAELEAVEFAQQQTSRELDEFRASMSQQLCDSQKERHDLMIERDALQSTLSMLKATGSELSSAQYRETIMRLETQLQESKLVQIAVADGASTGRRSLLASLVRLRLDMARRETVFLAEIALLKSKIPVDADSMSSSNEAAQAIENLKASVSAANETVEKALAQLSEAKEREEWEEEALANRELCDALTSELNDQEPAMKASQEEITRLRGQVRHFDVLFTKLTSESFGASHAQNLLRDQVEILSRRSIAASERIRSLESQLASTEKRVQSLREEADNAAAAKRDMQLQLERERHDLRELTASQKDASPRITELSKQVNSLKQAYSAEHKALAGAQADLLSTQSEAVKLRLRNERFKRKVEELETTLKEQEKFLQGGPGSGGASSSTQKALLEELRHVKSKLKCSVCSSREKSVVLTKCFHTFCRECIENTIASRQRKCPGCARPFGVTDVQTIYFT